MENARHDTDPIRFPTGLARPAVLASLTVLLALSPGPSRASCGAESCPLDNTTLNGPRVLTLEVSYQHVVQDRLRAGTADADRSRIEIEGGEVFTRSRLTMTRVTMPLPWRTQISASLPVVDRLHRHVSSEGLPQPELREWQYHGLGDLTLLANWVAVPELFASAPLSVSLQGGVKLPTGRRSVPDIAGEELEPHAHPGSGSTDVLAGLSIVQRVPTPTLAGPGRTTAVFASALFQYTGRGTDGARLGRSFESSVGASHPLPARLSLVAQVNTRVHGKDHFDGAAVAEEGGHHLRARDGSSTGRLAITPPGGGPTLLHGHAAGGYDEDTGGTGVFASPGLRFDGIPGVALSGYAQIPVYQRVNGTQLVTGPQWYFGASYRLLR